MRGVGMKFEVVAQIFDEIDRTASRLEITAQLALLLRRASVIETEIIVNLALGLLRPAYKGSKFNFSVKSFIPVLADLSQIAVEHVQSRYEQLGDLGSVAQEIIGNRSGKSLEVVEIYQQLVALENYTGTGSQELKASTLLSLLGELDGISAKYIVRIIIGTLRLGFSDMTLVDALSWMETGNKSIRLIIEAAYNRCADLGFIASQLKDGGVERIKSMGVVVGIPVRLAAAERLPSPQEIFDKIGSCIAQPKLDGMRLQIHLDKKGVEGNPRVNFFSRNLLDVTHMFPELANELLKLPVEQLIADGEAIVYDPNTKDFLPFQETAKRKRKHGIEAAVEELPVKLFLFDILYENGIDFLDEPFYFRRKKLIDLLMHAPETIQLISQREINSAHELEEYFLEMIEHGLEGVVVKKIDSSYQAGKRNFNWIKFKRLAQDELEDTIDCVIVGYYAGAGKRAALGMGAFLVGIFNPQQDCFQTVAKVGSGLTDEEWRELKKKCDVYALKERPHNVECAKELYPDVWILPQIVCSVLADEITRSPLHTAGKTQAELGYALRFPRFVGYREDKSPEQATSVLEFLEMYAHQKSVKK